MQFILSFSGSFFSSKRIQITHFFSVLQNRSKGTSIGDVVSHIQGVLEKLRGTVGEVKNVQSTLKDKFLTTLIPRKTRTSLKQ